MKLNEMIYSETTGMAKQASAPLKAALALAALGGIGYGGYKLTDGEPMRYGKDLLDTLLGNADDRATNLAMGRSADEAMPEMEGDALGDYASPEVGPSMWDALQGNVRDVYDKAGRAGDFYNNILSQQPLQNLDVPGESIGVGEGVQLTYPDVPRWDPQYIIDQLKSRV